MSVDVAALADRLASMERRIGELERRGLPAMSGVYESETPVPSGVLTTMVFTALNDPLDWLTSGVVRPTTAGWYRVAFMVQLPTSSATRVFVQVARGSGKVSFDNRDGVNNGQDSLSATGATLVNGTTDTLTFDIFQNSGSTLTPDICQLVVERLI